MAGIACFESIGSFFNGRLTRASGTRIRRSTGGFGNFFWQGSRFAATLAVEHHPVSTIAQTIKGCRAHELVGEGRPPFGEIKVAGEDGACAFISLGDQVMEVFVLR